MEVKPMLVGKTDSNKGKRPFDQGLEKKENGI